MKNVLYILLIACSVYGASIYYPTNIIPIVYVANGGSFRSPQDVVVPDPPDPPEASGDVYPDYDTNGVPNVSLSWMDAFDPPVSNYTVSASAPQIAEWIRQGQPGDTIALTGENL